MSHEIDVNENGTANAVYNRRPGWHGLGTTWQPGDDSAARLDLAEAMRLGNLADWNVRKVPFWAEDTNGDVIDAPEWAMTVRNNPVDPDAPAQPLGIVSADGYQVVQNEEAFSFGENLLDAGLEVEAAGSLRHGRQVFVLYRIPREIEVGGDHVLPYLLVTTSHDKSLALQAVLTGVRVECANMMAMALAQQTPRYVVRHFGEGMPGRIAEARDALGYAVNGMDAFEAEMRKWLDRDVTAAEFDKIMAVNFPKPDELAVHPTTMRTWDETVTAIRALHDVSPTNAAIKGTAWGAAQAMLEWHDWVGGSDKDRAKKQVGIDADRFRRGVFAKTAKVLALA